jgi:hypothetical protein
VQYILVVTRPFGPFRRGDVINDAVLITQIMAGENAASVVRVSTAIQPGA